MMKNKITIFIILSLLFIGCSKDESVSIVKNIDANNLSELTGITIGRYYITTNITQTTYTSCIYFPFPDEINSIACEASLTNYTGDHLLRLKEGSNDIVYIPANANKFANAEFSLKTGKGLNPEASGKEIIVYKVFYDKKNNIYRLTYEK